MICNKCNFQNEETAKFCRNCGAELCITPESTPMPLQKRSNSSVAWIFFVIALIICVVLGIMLYETNKKNDTIIEEEVIQRKGVVINGIRWATCNVGEKDTFVSQLHHLGNLYTWHEAKDVCPAGWRLPTKDEIDDLLRAPNRWTTINGVNGQEFGIPPDVIFLPAAGFCYAFGGELSLVGSDGFYWSSMGSEYQENKAYYLYCNRDFVRMDSFGNCSYKRSIRAVAE